MGLRLGCRKHTPINQLQLNFIDQLNFDMSVTCFDFVDERTFVRYVLRIYNVYHDLLMFK